MFVGIGPEAALLRDGTRELLAKACPPATVRAAWPGGDPAVVAALWQSLGELGLLAALVPEAHGGLGLGPLVAVAGLEEAGWAGVPGPLVETVTAVAPLLAAAGDPLLGEVLAGRRRVTAGRPGAPVPYAAASQDALLLDGQAYVVSCAGATRIAAVDGSRAPARLSDATGRVLDVAPAAIGAARTAARLGTAAFLVGLARRQLDLTVAYVSGRRQFGVPVGAFQAVKHPLADAALAMEFARPMVLRAACSVAEDAPDAPVHVAQAKLLASEAAYATSRVCLQAHGAIGYTTEYDLHLFAKRSWALAADWGAPGALRAELATHLGLAPAGPHPPEGTP